MEYGRQHACSLPVGSISFVRRLQSVSRAFFVNRRFIISLYRCADLGVATESKSYMQYNFSINDMYKKGTEINANKTHNTWTALIKLDQPLYINAELIIFEA